DLHEIYTGFQYYVVSGIEAKWIPMLVLLLLWPLLAGYWEWFFSRERKRVRTLPYKVYLYGVITTIGVSVLFWASALLCLLSLVSNQSLISTPTPNTPHPTPTSIRSNLIIYHGHTDHIYSVAWSPDGKHIASGS